MSGHSKWAQIKHKKAVTDAKKGQLFSKLVKEISIAAREDKDRDSNPRLRTAIERARAQGLPKENIERAVERGSGSGDEGALQEFLCEATAPGGVMILIEGITDSKNRSIAEIKHILSEAGAKLADPGSLIWNFEKIGVIEIQLEENQSKTEDEIADIIIESGAVDFHKVDSSILVQTEFADVIKIRAHLEVDGLVVTESGHNYKPRVPLVLSSQVLEKIEHVLDLLSDHDDVQEVFTNLADHTNLQSN